MSVWGRVQQETASVDGRIHHWYELGGKRPTRLTAGLAPGRIHITRRAMYSADHQLASPIHRTDCPGIACHRLLRHHGAGCIGSCSCRGRKRPEYGSRRHRSKAQACRPGRRGATIYSCLGEVQQQEALERRPTPHLAGRENVFRVSSFMIRSQTRSQATLHCGLCDVVLSPGSCAAPSWKRTGSRVHAPA